MIGTTGWTANSQTDIDNDGCEAQSEDVDDDNDQVPDDSDLCTNRRSDSNDGNGLFNYPLTNSWSEESNGLNDAVPRGSPSFTSVNGVDALYLSGYDSVEFPMALSQGLNHSDKVQFSLNQKILGSKRRGNGRVVRCRILSRDMGLWDWGDFNWRGLQQMGDPRGRGKWFLAHEGPSTDTCLTFVNLLGRIRCDALE